MSFVRTPGMCLQCEASREIGGGTKQRYGSHVRWIKGMRSPYMVTPMILTCPMHASKNVPITL